MKLTDIVLIALACLCAYGAIDPDGAEHVLRAASNKVAAYLRG